MLSVAAVVLMAVGVVAQAKPSFDPQAKPSFAGEWKIVAEGGRRGSEPGVDLTITQSATAMTVEYRGGVKLTYKLDGSVSKWAGNNLVVTTTTGAGEEKRTFSMDSGYLVVETSAPARSGGAPNVTKVVYQRYERGFGG
jgi:hypothetical protein